MSSRIQLGSSVLKLPTGWVYGGPTSTDVFESTPCKCNTVVYSVLAACGVCQLGNSNVKAIDVWPTYASNCTKKYKIQRKVTGCNYPEPIPDETAIPKWAFLDVISNSNFDVDAAESVAAQGLPDVTTETSSVSTSTTPSSRTTASSTPASDKFQNISQTGTQMGAALSQQSDKNVGVIVGGVIGTLIGLLLVGALVLYIILRHRRQASRESQSLSSSQTPAVRELGSLETPMYHDPTLKGLGGGASMRGLYDPDDPRTYPTPRRAAMGYTGLPQVMS
ncbi:hypothetical protein GSI_02022 [Ganoderma sinense ZZ0214-1]|uniref:Mid2 domain-containing protein n=1 Tax=Ganoderma sinense ZZ0214-1 TaxID=1077348 RepID=A0A2G8SNE5_9APHY|nr:hypothetical protein GSI_02022 [Ganoderma sinense ZZ0214-1]